MIDYVKDGKKKYTSLNEYSEIRSKELSDLLGPYIQVTDQYGCLICRLTLILGRLPPKTEQEGVIRDLMADVFDFLYEARALILKGKLVFRS